MLLAWAAGAVVMGAALGSIAHDVTGLLDSDAMRQYITALGGEQGLTDAFLAAEVAIFGAIVGGYALAASTRLRSEETSGHLENIMATATTRVRWAFGHVVVALAGTALLLVLVGASIGAAHGAAVGDAGGQVVRMVGAAAAQVPAAWVMAGTVVLLFGWLPRWVPLAWGLFVAFIVVGEFGALWKLPDWLQGLSPFTHSPTLPGGSLEVGSLLGLCLVAAALLVAGLVGWRRRDLQP
jgi:ABC-2 type transport system permease protein